MKTKFVIKHLLKEQSITDWSNAIKQINVTNCHANYNFTYCNTIDILELTDIEFPRINN